MRRAKQVLVAIASICMLSAWLPVPARAALVATEQALHPNSAARSQINAFFAREEVRKVLIDQGVDPAQVQARVDALTDEEANNLAARIDKLPAGGDLGTVLGFLLAVFVILLITDILGLTKVFPFTRPVR